MPHPDKRLDRLGAFVFQGGRGGVFLHPMRCYVGLTDRDWYNQLSAEQPEEVNFWKPGEEGGFQALHPGELFLFKLKSPESSIVGGAFFVSFSRFPVSLAWAAFGTSNGVLSLEQFRSRIAKYRRNDAGPDPFIGNIILTNPFWFARSEWVPAPANWSPNIVQGKVYSTADDDGAKLIDSVRERLSIRDHALPIVAEGRARYDERTSRVRLGQGAFRIVVTDAYMRKCSITGESTLPVLEAAHIRPYADEGPHELANGLLMRSDMHILFDKGLLTVTPELRIEVSSAIREQYTNGKLYYSYHGESLRSLPSRPEARPGAEYLSWHNENVYVG